MEITTVKIRFKTLLPTEVLVLDNFKYIAVSVSNGTCTLENNETIPEQLILVDSDNWTTGTDGGISFKYLKLTANAGATVRIEYHA